ncbi:hypothetical protein PHYC_02395 [Phycisphaerales bacterium]|nr:hypothetical protein PHYC_02395 [Phycisphaerales bacterium]
MKPFRPRSARALYEAHHGPNMTPMVDVVMVILIFFMASTAILGPEWFLRSALPVVAPAAADLNPPARLHIALLKGGVARVTLDDQQPQTTTTFHVETRLRDESASRGAANLVVLVEPAPDAPYDDVVRVHEWCAALGIAKVGIVEPPP